MTASQSSCRADPCTLVRRAPSQAGDTATNEGGASCWVAHLAVAQHGVLADVHAAAQDGALDVGAVLHHRVGHQHRVDDLRRKGQRGISSKGVVTGNSGEQLQSHKNKQSPVLLGI